jgi:hypothetical protein
MAPVSGPPHISRKLQFDLEELVSNVGWRPQKDAPPPLLF